MVSEVRFFRQALGCFRCKYSVCGWMRQQLTEYRRGIYTFLTETIWEIAMAVAKYFALQK